MRNSFIVSASLCAALAGCSSGMSKGVTVSASTASAVGAAPKAGATSIDGGNGISIDRVRLVVKKFEIEGASACASAASGSSSGMSGSGGMGGSSGSTGSDDASGSDGGECEIESGPFLVDLSGGDLATGVHPVTGIDVPSGTYEELRFQIHVIDASQAGTSAGLAAMAAAGASILVDGAQGGAPFQFKSTITVDQKREGKIVVDPSTGVNVTLDLDASGWFKAADGSKLDPADAAASSAIEANIRSSVRVIHDDDHDGEDDDHGSGG
jgi:hypothetical protein